MGPAIQVWLDGTGTRSPQTLHADTSKAKAVLPVGCEPGSLLVVVRDDVMRIGSRPWRVSLKDPSAAVIVGDTALVTECGAGRVTSLNIETGETRGSFGEGILKQPLGIAVGPREEIVVVAWSSMMVYVFDGLGRPIRTLGGPEMMARPCCVCVDALGRVYVTDAFAKAIVVLDMSNNQLAKISVAGQPYGVAVTRTGKVLVSCSDTEERLTLLG
jgi:YVTN family beta-propeller protein